MNTVNIDKLADLVSDESLYSAKRGPRLPNEPSFIFFDDHKEEDDLVKWAREEALDFEEWNAARSNWTEETVPLEHMAYLERQSLREQANWLIGWHKRRTGNNDHWRQLVMPLLAHIEKPEIAQIVKALKESLPFAPGPLRSTLYINPDGSKAETASTSIGAAKVGYCKRHNIDGEFVSVERVQKEGESFSRLVVGMRRTSDQTISRYYDPNPAFAERVDNGKWTMSYKPSATNLYLVGESMVMPHDAHRLTVREFEQALIAGATLIDDEGDILGDQLESQICYDDRSIGMEMGYGSECRTYESLCEDEQFLYDCMRMVGNELGCELLLLRNQDEDCMRKFFASELNPTTMEEALEGDDAVSEIIKAVTYIEKWDIKVKRQFTIEAGGKRQVSNKATYSYPEDTMIGAICSMICPHISLETL